MSTTPTPPDPGSILAGVDLFAGFGGEVRAALESRARRISLPVGARVFQSGETSDELFVLVSGSLEVSVNRSGRRVVLTTLTPGDYFGEMAMLAAEPRSATVTAISESVVLEMSRHQLMEIFREHPDRMDQMVKIIAARKRANTPVLQGNPASPAPDTASTAPTGLLGRIKHWLFPRR